MGNTMPGNGLASRSQTRRSIWWSGRAAWHKIRYGSLGLSMRLATWSWLIQSPTVSKHLGMILRYPVQLWYLNGRCGRRCRPSTRKYKYPLPLLFPLLFHRVSAINCHEGLCITPVFMWLSWCLSSIIHARSGNIYGLYGLFSQLLHFPIVYPFAVCTLMLYFIGQFTVSFTHPFGRPFGRPFARTLYR